jgi:hypothetical protein
METTKYFIYFNSECFEQDVVVVYTAVRHIENLHLPVFLSNHKLYVIEKRAPKAGIHEMNREVLGYAYIS